MKDRIINHWKTTILGAFILVAGLLLVWFQKTDLVSLAGFIPVALGLFVSKDPGSNANGPPIAGAGAVFFIVLILVGSGCSPEQRLSRLVTRHPELIKMDTIRITDTIFIPAVQKDTAFADTFTQVLITVPADTIRRDTTVIAIVQATTFVLTHNIQSGTIQAKVNRPASQVISNRPPIIRPYIIVKYAMTGKQKTIWFFWGLLAGIIVSVTGAVIMLVRARRC